MSDLISRQAAIDAIEGSVIVTSKESVQAVIEYIRGCADRIRSLPSAQPDARLKKIADLVDGTIDHFDRDDAMDLLYQIKEVLK